MGAGPTDGRSDVEGPAVVVEPPKGWVGEQATRQRAGHRRLPELRRAAGMTQRELAQYLGVSVRTLAYWEAGRPVPPAATRQLARLLRRPLPQINAAVGLTESSCGSPPHPVRPQSLGDAVAALRRSSGLSAAELGRRLGVSRWTMRRWESGSTRPSPEACRRLESVLGMPPGSLARLMRRGPAAAPDRRGAASAGGPAGDSSGWGPAGGGIARRKAREQTSMTTRRLGEVASVGRRGGAVLDATPRSNCT